MNIIPAIDVIDGKCVRLTKGDYSSKKIYNEDPLEVAKEFEASGIKYLHLVDLDGAKSNHVVNQNVLERLTSNTSLKIDFGGGIKSDEDIRIAFESGASQITAGSIAVKNRALFLQWLNTYGPERIILGADCLNRKIATQGWLENSETDVIDFISSYQKCGVQQVICTDISKDGMLQGAAEELYKEILKVANVSLIASGGVSGIDDLRAMEKIGCSGVIVGKAIYEGKIELKDLVVWL